MKNLKKSLAKKMPTLRETETQQTMGGNTGYRDPKPTRSGSKCTTCGKTGEGVSVGSVGKKHLCHGCADRLAEYRK